MFEIDEVNMKKTLQIPKNESRGRQMNHHGTAVDRESSTERQRRANTGTFHRFAYLPTERGNSQIRGSQARVLHRIHLSRTSGDYHHMRLRSRENLAAA